MKINHIIDEAVSAKFLNPQATAQDPGLEREKDVDVIFFGLMPQDFTARTAWKALEDVLPREYPAGSERAQNKIAEVSKNNGAVVTTKPLSIAQKLVKEFQERGIKCRINAPGLEEDITRRGFLQGAGAAAVTGAVPGASTAGDFKSINDLNKDPESIEKVWKPRMTQLQARCANILKSFVSVAPGGYDAAEIIQNAKLKITLGEEQFRTGYVRSSWSKDAKGNVVGVPSGEIFLDTTVFWDAPDEVLAFILGHELGHVILRHGMQTGDIPVDTSKERGRRNELEADNIGAYLARQIGYNKAGYFKFLFGKRAEYMTDMNADSSHPSPAIRAKSMSQGLGKKIDFELSHNAVKYIDSMIQQFQSGLVEEATDPTNKPNSNIPRWLQVLTKDYPITQFEKARYAREKHDGYNKWADNQQNLNNKEPGVKEGTAGLPDPQNFDSDNDYRDALDAYAKPQDTDADYENMDETKEKVGNMDADAFDAALTRMKKLAGQGPLRTVYDPAKRVYKNVPHAVQPAQQPKKAPR
jgi:hypothetical protein